MDTQTNIERLIEVATMYGYTEEQIVVMVDEIGMAAYQQFAQEVEKLLTPDEKHSLENLVEKEKARGEIEKLYQEKTGRDVQETINTYLTRHIDEFIKDHISENTAVV